MDPCLQMDGLRAIQLHCCCSPWLSEDQLDFPVSWNFQLGDFYFPSALERFGRNWQSGQRVQTLLGCLLLSGDPDGQFWDIHRPQTAHVPLCTSLSFPSTLRTLFESAPGEALELIVPWVQVNDFAHRWGAVNMVPSALSCCRESSPAAEAAFPLPVFHFELLEVLNKK